VIDKEKQKKGGHKVDGYIYEMVSKDIVPAKIVIQGKTETCYRTIISSAWKWKRKKRFLDVLPGEFCEMYTPVFDNIGNIIKMPRGIKTV
jgi:hypothetical protein